MLNNAHMGTWDVRTGPITANSAGKLEWVERLILNFKGPIGTAGKLKLQLVDTAANTGAGQLPMPLWTWTCGSGRTHRPTKQKCPWPMTRARRVGDDSKCVVIASSGLQRAAANVGAGGMLKKNLPSKHGSDLSMTEEQLVEHKRVGVGQSQGGGAVPLYKRGLGVSQRLGCQSSPEQRTDLIWHILSRRTSPAPHPHPRKPLPPPPPDNHQLLAAQLQAGKEAVTQGKNSLAAKLAASPVWASLTLDAESFPSTGKQEYRPLMDWKVVIAVRLVIENQLPIKGTYFMWDTPKGWWQHGLLLLEKRTAHSFQYRQAALGY
ncbi:hypothetical protein WJX79_005854 [Trebouxia sp. C0005]